MATKKLLVSIADDALADFAAVVRECERAGLHVAETMDTIGVITGTIDAAKLDGLRRVRGVRDVEDAGTATIAPPESDVQ